MKRYDCVGTKVSCVDKESAVKHFFDNIETAKNNYICCANAHTVVTAYEDNDYQKILNQSFLTLPDGSPVAYKGNKYGAKKVSGVDFFEEVLIKSNKNINHYIYGNKKENIDKLIDVIKDKYKNVNVVGYEPSVFRDLTEKEKNELKNRIVEAKADIAWVGIGAPRQEILCSELCKDTGACFVAVGGAFNVVADIIPRAPKWMQNMGLEWFFRLCKEPRRLIKRYLIGNFKYIWINLIYKEK